MIKPVDKIVIVGGGSAGWMSAAALIRAYPNKDITVIESPNVPTVGVGESTLGQFRHFCHFLQIDNKDFMASCDASFKMSIQFTDFYEKDSGSFHYPFGQVVHNPKEWWENSNLLSTNKYAEDINPVALVAESGKFDRSTSYAFHFDAVKFGQYLRKTYCNAVKHVTAEVIGCKKGENGIEYLKLDNGDIVEADLFIDCSGFKSLLLGEYMEEPFIPYDHLIPNDTAWATQVSYTDKEKQLVAYTECTAIDNGWVWNIPLWDRIGTGYVYSSKHVSDEDAKQEFIIHLQSKGFDTSECVFKRISMRIGRHKRTFVKNVVAIGLSAGFIEPLESNGLFTVHQNLIDLYKTLRRGKPSQYMKDIYNSATSLSFDEFADFVRLS